MPFATYSEDDPLQDWYIQNLPDARTALSKFPILNGIFDGLKGYESKHHSVRQNVFIDGVFPEIKGWIKTQAITLLEEIENALSQLNYCKWNSKEQRKLVERITTENPHQSLSVFTELLIANRMIKRIGISNINFHPNVDNENESDLEVIINGTSINCEITNLATGLAEQKIKQIFSALTEYLGTKINRRKYGFRLHINTFELCRDHEEKIDVETSIRLLKAEIDRLQLEHLEGYEGYFTFDRIDWLLKHQGNTWDGSLDMIDREIIDNLNTPPLSKWIPLVQHELSKNSPIVAIDGGFFAKDSKPLIEIHSDDHYPSRSGEAEKQSFLNHIIRRIDEKIKHGQLISDVPNVIIIQAYNWLFSVYEYTESDFQPIRYKIISYLEDVKPASLSGVLIFSIDFDNGIFIPNQHASVTSQLSTKHLVNLQFRLRPNHTF